MELLEPTSSSDSLLNISQPIPLYLDSSLTLNGSQYVDKEILLAASGSKFQETKNDFAQVTLFDSETVKCWIELIIPGILTTAVAMFGILGNSLSISVLSKKKMQSSISVLMIGLSLSDLIVCLSSSFVIGIPQILKYSGVGTEYLKVVCDTKRFIFPFALAALAGSTYFTVAIGIERYFAVCWPIQCRSYLTRTKTIAVSAFIVLLAFAINAPNFILYYSKDPEKFSYKTRNCNATESSQSLPKFVSYFVFMYTIPLAVVTLMNVLILFKVRKMNVRRDTMTPYQRRKIRLTNMLITIVAVYLVCNIAKVANEITKLVVGKTYAEVVTVTNFLVTFNSSVNYLIYCAFGKTFRQSFINLFLKCGNPICNCSECSARHLNKRNNAETDQTPSDCSSCRKSFNAPLLCGTLRTVLFRIKRTVPLGSRKSQMYNINPD